MATYETSFLVPRSAAATFAFVSDFTNAAKWDPRTYSVEKVTPGPIGTGTVFMLRGGLLPRDLIPKGLPLSLFAQPLPYEVREYAPPHRLVLVGENRVFRYRDDIDFAEEGGATRVTYRAELGFKGLLAVGEPALKLVFKKIGDGATRDIPAAVMRG